MSAKAPAKGHTAKHTASKKHATSSGKSGTKHTPAKHKQAATEKSKGHAQVHAKGTHAKEAKAAGFAIGDLLPVCAFEAVAQWLRLAGQRVHEDDVAELWWLAGEREATIPEAAEALGLTSERKNPAAWAGLSYSPAGERGRGPGFITRSPGCVLGSGHHAVPRNGLILRIDVPGPHAVLATADGWWSWGELYSPWPCTVSEAWAVSWS